MNRSIMRRMNGRAPGSTCEAKESFPISVSQGGQLDGVGGRSAWRRRERSSSRRSGVQERVCRHRVKQDTEKCDALGGALRSSRG